MIDTLKIKTPLDVFNDYNLDFFTKTEPGINIKTGSVPASFYQLSSRDKGGAYVKLQPESDQAVIEFSAKTLGREYPQGLTENNIFKAIDQVNSVSVFNINAYKLLEQGEVLRVDTCLNSSEQSKDEVLASLRSVVKCRYKTKKDIIGSSSIYFNKNSKSENIKFYDKYLEAEQHNQTSGLFDINTIRFEVSQKSKDKIIGVSGSDRLSDIIQLSNSKKRLSHSLSVLSVDHQLDLKFSEGITLLADKNIKIQWALLMTSLSGCGISNFYNIYSEKLIKDLLRERHSHLRTSAAISSAVSRDFREIRETLSAAGSYSQESLIKIGEEYLATLRSLVA